LISTNAKMAWKKHKDQESVLYSEFSLEELRATGEDYLEAVLILYRQKGDVRCVDLATFLERSKPTVTNMVTRLCESGFLVREDNKTLSLTTKGKEVAEKIYERHRFFTQRLIDAGVDPETAERDACRLEHAISEESFQKLKDALEN
jgi:Mn-dependent DtxR family transcriptional regulator